jgi:hypothetical protein
MKPKVSIGIPTFNRAQFLPESLGSALNQSLPDIEILVSDNASTDATEEVVAAMRDERVRYVKQPRNMGGTGNFQALLDLATADYFCLLQDDDMIFPDLAARAYAALEENADAAWYAPYALSQNDIGVGYHTVLYGPPFRLNWREGKCRKVDGDLLLPMCLFITPAIPPVTVFRTDVFRRAFKAARAGDCPLLSERVWVAHASRGSRVIVDPYIGGWFRTHPEQASTVIQRDERALQHDWRIMRDAVSAIAAEAPEPVGVRFAEYLREVPPHIVAQWAGILSEARPRGPFDEDVLGMLLRHAGSARLKVTLKSIGRSLTPPVLWGFLRDRLLPPYERLGMDSPL